MAMRTLRCSWLLVALLPACGAGDDASGGTGVSAADSGRGPRPAVHGLTAAGELRLHPDDRCPLCAMVPAKRPEFAAAIESIDGRTWYFCGNGCMLRTNLHPEIHLGLPADQLSRRVVQDYFTGEPLDAAAAFWVAGSDVVGPMGPAVVALRSEADVATFRARHGGEHVFRLAEVDDARWTELTGKPALKEGELQRE